ncbi:hypothetical protein BKA80DRAFT_282458 [Phyllosticta citrichinensis]
MARQLSTSRHRRRKYASCLVEQTIHLSIPCPLNQRPPQAMFHQGDLQSGISLALQQSKSVACFVTGASLSTAARPCSCGARQRRSQFNTWSREWLTERAWDR